MSQFFLFQLFDSLSWKEIIGGIIACVLGLSALVSAIKTIRTDGWKAFKDRWIMPRQARRKKIDELVDKFDAMGSKIDRIDAELRTNGGSSVKDMVCRIDCKVEHIQARVRHQDETSDRPIFELDQRGHLTFANCAFRELVNADEQDLTHRSYVSRIHVDDRTRFIRELAEAIENKMPIDSTVKFRQDDRSFVSVRLLANPDVRPGGELMGFFGTASRTETVTK